MEKTNFIGSVLDFLEKTRLLVDKVLYTSSKIMGGETLPEEEDKVAEAIKNTIEKVSELFEAYEPYLIVMGLAVSVTLLVRETRKVKDC